MDSELDHLYKILQYVRQRVHASKAANLLKEILNSIDESERLVREVYDQLRMYEAAIRKHRDQRGDDRCWMDDEELYKVLPEGYVAPKRDSCVELELCKKYIASRHNPNIEYISPQRRIEELECQIKELK